MKKLSNIKLNITDFGPINKANIELKKLNIIAGTNGSGKTTSSKLLYCFLTSNSDEKEYLANMSINRRIRSTINYLLDNFEFKFETELELRKLENELIFKSDDNTYNYQFTDNINLLKKIVNESQITNKETYLEKINAIEHALEINSIEPRQFFEVSSSLINSEFRINDLNLDKSNVQFYGKQKDNEFLCKLDYNESKFGFILDQGDLNSINIKNMIYIDSPSIFNSKSVSEAVILRNQPYHLRFLSRILSTHKNNDDVYESLFNQKLDEFKDNITELLGGFIYYDDEKEEFFFKKGDEDYSMNDTASGVKQLGIIQMLLSNRKLTENSFLIMDEPEVNLHPEWQVKFAELIVLMIKELDISIFINSHSPQFIEALEVYSAKYELSDETKFYLSKESEHDKFDFEEILRDDLVILYNNLGNPYNRINKVRAENMRNGIF